MQITFPSFGVIYIKEVTQDVEILQNQSDRETFRSYSVVRIRVVQIPLDHKILLVYIQKFIPNHKIFLTLQKMSHYSVCGSANWKNTNMDGSLAGHT